MHRSKTSGNALPWAAFLASYVLIFLMISVPIARQMDIFEFSESVAVSPESKN